MIYNYYFSTKANANPDTNGLFSIAALMLDYDKIRIKFTKHDSGFYFVRESRPTKKSSDFYVTRQIMSTDEGRPTKSPDFIVRLSSALED